ncbi:hypothetical protein AB1N83_014016 [Pleurotus pulmonarius]
MYDILEAHRWAVMERNVVHGDISHGNIFILAEGVGKVKEKKRKELMGKDRPIFVNEIIEDEENADPMACLGDPDDGAELDHERAVPRAYVSKRIRMNDEPRRCRTGTPKFIARKEKTNDKVRGRGIGPSQLECDTPVFPWSSCLGFASGLGST